MESSPRVALVVGGAVRQYPLLRLPAFVERIGPVKAQSVRVASRIVNSLRSGYPVSSYPEFEDSQLVVVCVPAHRLAPTVAGMAASELAWEGRCVATSDSLDGSASLRPLAKAGALVCSFTPVEGFDGRYFLVEGDRKAVRSIRSLLAAAQVKTLEFRACGPMLYRGALTFAHGLFPPLVDAVLTCLRKSGLSPSQAAAVTEMLMQTVLRMCLKAGRKGFRGTLASKDVRQLQDQVAAMAEAEPGLASYLLASAAPALKRLGRDSAWLSDLNDALRKASSAR